MKITLSEILSDAVKKSYAIAGFNVFSLAWARAVVEAAESLQEPVIIMTNRGMVDCYPPRQIGPALSYFAETASIPVCVHLDHCSDLAVIQQAIEYGYSSVMYDGSALPFEENLQYTAIAAKSAHDSAVSIEGELGTVAYSDIAESRSNLTRPEEVEEFTKLTKIDALAVSVGNVHRLTQKNSVINYSLLSRIKNQSRCPLVIHGSSGIRNEDLVTMAQGTVAKFNFGTSLRLAFSNALRKNLCNNKDLFDWLSIEALCIKAIEEEARSIMRLLRKNNHKELL